MESSRWTRSQWLTMPQAGLAVTMVMRLLVAITCQDMHGGVKMGEINIKCDDAIHGVEIDWDVNNTEPYQCYGPLLGPGSCGTPKYIHENKTRPPTHVCLKNMITYDTLPLSGPHRPLWPIFGEYTFCPPQRWVHSLEHAAVVFLYHPCADYNEVDKFRQLVTGCLRKHIITPCKMLTTERPFALITWGNGIFFDHFDEINAKDFIKNHGMKDGPEALVVSDGDYKIGLKKKARIVGGDIRDRHVCQEYEKLHGL